MQKKQLAATLLLLGAAGLSTAAEGTDPILGMGFDDLMKIKVVSVQRRATPLASTPAPIYVLTADDIHRSGATILPDVLRLVPGLQVARTNGNNWSVAARGFNTGAANKMLVLIDGRTVYSQLNAGVFWDANDIPLDSIERIEVILGPGGSLWGANAVNGIINVIRKPAAERQGTAVSVTGGNEDRFIGQVSQGFKIASSRGVAYARYHEFDDTRLFGQSGGASDEGKFGIGGFRLDGKAGESEWSVSGDGYTGEFGQTSTVSQLTPPFRFTYNDDTTINGNNVVGKVRIPAAGGAVSFQTYYDRTERRIPRLFHETRNTVQADAQHELPVLGRHTITYGGYARETSDIVGNSFSIAWDPSAETTHLFSLFAQDHIQFTNRLSFTLGSKYERNDYTGWELQPSLRAGYQLTGTQFVWAGVSRAVRTPTRLDADARIVGAVQPAGPTSLEVQGGEQFDSEKLTAYEAGYRAQPTRRVYLSVSGFFNKYHDLRSIEQGATQFSTDPVPHNFVPYRLANNLWGESFGGEVAPRVQIFEWWRLEAQYSYLHLRLHDEDGSMDFTSVRTERNDPQHQVTFISSWNLPYRLEFDGTVRWVDELKNLNVSDYTAVDLRLGWAATSVVSMEVVGRNLFSGTHREYSGLSEVEPSVHGTVSCKFL